MKYDVIIAGGGVAGLSTSIFLKGLNPKYKILVLEKDKYPYQRKYGSSINPKGLQDLKWLRKLEKKLPFQKPSQIEFISPDFSKKATFRDKTMASWISHEDIENHLVKVAKDLDVEFHFSFPIIKVEAGIEGVCLKSEKKEIEGEVLVGADGKDSQVAKQLGIYEDLSHYSTYYGIYEIISLPKKGLSPMVSINYGKKFGYAYLWPFPKFIQIGLFLKEESFLEEVFQDWKSHLAKEKYLPADKEGKKVRRDVPAGAALLLERSYDKRTVLVGDAGGFVVNTTAEGLYPAMLSAKIASEIIHKGLKEKRMDDIIPSYSREWNLAFGEYIRGTIELNRNLNFLIEMIFSDPKICTRYGRGFFLGEKVI
ncbi:MAG: NAD(P)/FAD-dependent oxidoreductase [Planctomycetota bacterium]|nr:MAG: NAD(P)/FAD-dependent oxidoreductase [Planctomycetota bacterium]